MKYLKELLFARVHLQLIVMPVKRHLMTVLALDAVDLFFVRTYYALLLCSSTVYPGLISKCLVM